MNVPSGWGMNVPSGSAVLGVEDGGSGLCPPETELPVVLVVELLVETGVGGVVFTGTLVLSGAAVPASGDFVVSSINGGPTSSQLWGDLVVPGRRTSSLVVCFTGGGLVTIFPAKSKVGLCGALVVTSRAASPFCVLKSGFEFRPFLSLFASIFCSFFSLFLSIFDSLSCFRLNWAFSSLLSSFSWATFDAWLIFRRWWNKEGVVGREEELTPSASTNKDVTSTTLLSIAACSQCNRYCLINPSAHLLHNNDNSGQFYWHLVKYSFTEVCSSNPSFFHLYKYIQFLPPKAPVLFTFQNSM